MSKHHQVIDLLLPVQQKRNSRFSHQHSYYLPTLFKGIRTKIRTESTDRSNNNIFSKSDQTE